MEYVLHIAYRLKIKKWQVRTNENKLVIASRKKQIIEKFWEETGLLLDMPTQGGDNINDGNVKTLATEKVIQTTVEFRMTLTQNEVLENN